MLHLFIRQACDFLRPVGSQSSRCVPMFVIYLSTSDSGGGYGSRLEIIAYYTVWVLVIAEGRTLSDSFLHHSPWVSGEFNSSLIGNHTSPHLYTEYGGMFSSKLLPRHVCASQLKPTRRTDLVQTVGQ